MLLLNENIETHGLKSAAVLICVADRSAPKGKGKDLLVTALVTDDDKCRLQGRMRLIGERDKVPFFLRDAENLDHAPFVVLIGTRKEPLQLTACGYCGFNDCNAMLNAGGTCSFNAGDLGIAVGSAVSLAADLRVDNRIMNTAGKAAIELGILDDDFYCPMQSLSPLKGKNPFFDRS